MKKLSFVFIACLLSICGVVNAQSDFKVLYGPYLQMMGENEVTVMWVTNKEAVSWVELAPDDGSHFYAEERPQFFQTNFGKKVIGKLHSIRLTGLQKGTSYRYRIYSKEVMEQTPYYVQYGKVAASNVYTAKPYCFTTLDKAKEHISFKMINDIHGNNDVMAALLSDVKKEKDDFIFFNGDMVSNMVSEQQLFDGFMNQAVKIFATEMPFFFARGNHETRGMFSTEYIRYFPTSTGQPYYAFQEGPAFFIVLDGGEDKPDTDIEYWGLAAFDQYRENEINWLKEVVNSDAFKQSPFKIVVMHVPPVHSTWHGPLEVKKHFIPLLNKAGVDLMLCGHLHRYQFIPAGQEDCNFPILINSNKHVADVEVTTGKLQVVLKDTDQKVFKEFTFQRK